MAASRNSERCPQCCELGYSYDPVCKIWCCGRCHTTETTSAKLLREVAQSRPPEAFASEAGQISTFERETSDLALPVEVRRAG